MENEKLKSKNFYAGGFLYNPEKREVLLMLRDDKAPQLPNMWSFFGGASKKGEGPKECCLREWREELGIEIVPEKLIHLCDYFNEPHGKWRYIFYTESSLEKSKMTLGEGADFDWVSLEKVLEYNLTPVARHDLELFKTKI